MATVKKPDLSDPQLRAKLAKGMGHNYYGEPAWPNDLLYIFPVVILGTIALCVGLAVLDPSMNGEPANPFATPLEILPEWYLYPVFNILRLVPNKLLGIELRWRPKVRLSIGGFGCLRLLVHLLARSSRLMSGRVVPSRAGTPSAFQASLKTPRTLPASRKVQRGATACMTR